MQNRRARAAISFFLTFGSESLPSFSSEEEKEEEDSPASAQKRKSESLPPEEDNTLFQRGTQNGIGKEKRKKKKD